MSEAPRIYVQKFWTEYKPDEKNPGQLRGVDWVAYSPIGSVQKTVITEAVSRLSCVLPLTGKGGQNPAVQMANARWDAIKPYYEAWQTGREAPLTGIPLDAWNGVSPEQAQLFRMKGVRTVNEISELTDTHKGSMGIPGIHNIIESAKRFILAQDKSAVTEALAKKDAELAELRAQMAELAEMVKEARATPAPADSAPKRGGWPKGKPRKPAEQSSEAA